MIDINFIPWRILQCEKQRHFNPQAFLFLCLVFLVLLVVIHSGFYCWNLIANQEVNKLQATLQFLNISANKIKELENNVKLFTIFEEKQKNIHQQQINLLQFFNKFIQQFPNNAFLTELQYSEGKLTLKGVTQNALALYELQRALASAEIISIKTISSSKIVFHLESLLNTRSYDAKSN